MYDRSLVILHRDLRINDNTAIVNALQRSHCCALVFILTPEQLVQNDYYSPAAVNFMLQSVAEIPKINVYYGDYITTLKDIIGSWQPNAIFINIDYTPYATARTKSTREVAKENGIDCVEYEDYLLHNLLNDQLLTRAQTPYQKFTPYYNLALTIPVAQPVQVTPQDSKLRVLLLTNNIVSVDGGINMNLLPNICLSQPDCVGGRKAGLSLLSQLRSYERGNLSTPTSRLSPYIKFGCISIREVYAHAYSINKKSNRANMTDFIRELHWRDFYTRIVWYFPRVLEGPNRYMHSTDNKYTAYTNNPAYITAWKEGKTGIPAVDAGMRQLLLTGYMPNRARLITSSYLVKNLMVDWQIGEKYFAQMLTDYDPSVNNGNWQWIAGCGVDAQPYFRTFNPFKQGRKFDPDCTWIKKYIVELANVPNEDIHTWDVAHAKHNVYIAPIKN
jgi:deoxyribodipyrimidine photo-lyase